MRLVKTLVWTVLSYGAEALTLKVRYERKITSMEMWLWRRMMRISWMEKRTDNSILQEHDIKRELLGHVRKRKLSYFGHLCRDHGCQMTKTVVDGYVAGRRRRGRPRKQYIDSIKQWTHNITVRTGCRRPQPMETTRQSSDGGRRSHMICRKEECMYVSVCPRSRPHIVKSSNVELRNCVISRQNFLKSSYVIT